MGFRITVFSVTCAKTPQTPTPRSERHFRVLAYRPNGGRDRRLWLSFASVFLNSGSEGPLAIRDMRRFVQRRATGSTDQFRRRGLSFPI